MRRYIRDPFSALSHSVAALAALLGTAVLLAKTAGGVDRWLPMLIYGLSMTSLFAASGIYHLVRGPERLVARLRKLDHCAIFLLIAGTYTPTAYLVLGGIWRPLTLIIIWSLALAGILYKSFWIGARRWLSTLQYLLMGWLGVALLGQLRGQLQPGAIAWMLAGGAVYTAGAVLYMLKWPPLWPTAFDFHDLWHLFVIGGAVCHYVMHVSYLAPMG